MKCTDINIYIDGILDEELASLDLPAFEQHISTCTDCAEKVEIAKSLLSGLKNLPTPPSTIDFEQRIFAQVRSRYNVDHKYTFGHWFATGFSAVAVVSLTVWFVSSGHLPNSSFDQSQMISVAMNKSQPVRLMFDARTDIQKATLSIDLPDNVMLDGYPDRRALTWQTSLHKGPNVLALPIVAIGQGQGNLSTQLTYNDKVKTFRIELKTTTDDIQPF